MRYLVVAALLMIGCGGEDGTAAQRGSVSGTCPHVLDTGYDLAFCGATNDMPVTSTAVCGVPGGVHDANCDVNLADGVTIVACVAACP